MRVSLFPCILIRWNFFARSRNAVKPIRASTREMTSALLRALKAVTRAMFPRVASRVAIQEISSPRMNTYMIMALCVAKMIPRGSFRSAPTPGIVGLPRLSPGRIYHVKLLWRINHTPWILAKLSDKLRISTDTFALFTFHGVTRCYPYSYVRIRGSNRFPQDSSLLQWTSLRSYRTPERIIRYYFDCSKLPILSAFSRT